MNKPSLSIWSRAVVARLTRLANQVISDATASSHRSVERTTSELERSFDVASLNDSIDGRGV